MKVARYKKGFIKASEYNSKLHFDNIYCPDCGVAKVKLVRKANQESYFEFITEDNRHDELCPRISKPIDDNKIKELIASDSKKDMSKVNFIVNKNLERCINLLTKIENDGRLNHEDALSLMPKKKQQMAEKRIREYSKQDIYTINTFELADIDLEKVKGKYAVLYGVAGITSSNIGESLKLLFKINEGSRFSVFIAPNQTKYLNFDKSIRAKFAIFGKLKVVDKFINVEIRSTRDLVIRG
ncbi:hypothetical protein EDC55_1048 [Allofrancisella inopinata]|uniref:Uncharacterized protein n=1 Tax=Allofrancisella inopinata TaxID=1085647 RepID=A0AAE6YK84_9GAMM|nr:hypothetical protein [Allofrancisella inopinata]QIV96357.1 hypothetical protein E4K63_05765 [Allofrancisella inopinata]TDT73336.1 hypothetical protein EDC55_1048 [Allofrancisella inopinata]